MNILRSGASCRLRHQDRAPSSWDERRRYFSTLNTAEGSTKLAELAHLELQQHQMILEAHVLHDAERSYRKPASATLRLHSAGLHRVNPDQIRTAYAISGSIEALRST